MKNQFDTGEDIVFYTNSEFQEICVKQHPEHGKILLLNGEVQLTEKHEREYHDLIADQVKQDMKTALIIGGGDGYLAQRLVDLAFDQIIVVELGQGVVNVAIEHFACNVISSPDVQLKIMNGIDYLEWLETTDIKFDLIVFDVTDQDGDSLLYHEDILAICKDSLNYGGKLLLQSGCPINNHANYSSLVDEMTCLFGSPGVTLDYIECYGEYQSFIYGIK